MSDEELMEQFYQNNQEALNVLFKRHKQGLFNFALRLTGNRADAEDALSHAFMMVVEKRYARKPGASFKTWIYTVARNLSLTHLRKSSHTLSLWMTKKDSQEEQMMDIPDSRADAREQADEQEVRAIIQKAVGKLPKEQKEALLLREFHGFSYEEISQVLECSLEKVKVLIFRARQQLKDTIPPMVLEEGR